MIYSIVDLPISADAGRDTDGEHAMITLSQETGGQYFYAMQGNLRAAFKKVSEALRTQYLLGYYPDPKARGSQFRSISVTLTHPAPASGPYTVENRTGYYPDAAQ
jgi:Ca-activated chloride channel family protein